MSNPPLRTPFLTSSSAVQPAFKNRGGVRGEMEALVWSSLELQPSSRWHCVLTAGLAFPLSYSLFLCLPPSCSLWSAFLPGPAWQRGVCVCMGGSELLCRLSLGQLLQLPAHYSPQWQTVNREREREREKSLSVSINRIQSITYTQKFSHVLFFTHWQCLK